MNSDVLATICTLILLATKIALASGGEVVSVVFYFVEGFLIYVFWQVMRGICDAITGKNYIRSLSLTEEFRVYRDDRPVTYWYRLLISVTFNASLAAFILNLIKPD